MLSKYLFSKNYTEVPNEFLNLKWRANFLNEQEKGSNNEQLLSFFFIII